MKENEKCPTGIVMNNAEIRKLILENPDLPIVFRANDEANNGDYTYMFCTYVYAQIGEVLDCEQEIDEGIIFTDRESFEDAVYDKVVDDAEEYNYSMYGGKIGHVLSEEDVEAEAKRVMSEYAPYWKPCILITVGN